MQIQITTDNLLLIVCTNQDIHLSVANWSFHSLQFLRWQSMSIPITEEQNTRSLTRCALIRLNPLADARRSPNALYETQRAAFNVGTIVTAHDGFDGFSGFVGVIEGDRGDVVMEDVRLNNTVQKLSSDESKLAVNGSGGATDVVPTGTGIVWKRGVSVLEVGNCNYMSYLVSRLNMILNELELVFDRDKCLPSQWLTHI